MTNYERYFGTVEAAAKSFRNSSSLHMKFQEWLVCNLKELDMRRDFYIQWLESEAGE